MNAAAGARYITVIANGLSFEVLEAGAGDRLALCLHGFPQNAEMWRRHIDTLVALGYRVWAPNQRGYGKTSKPPGVAAYHVNNLVADVAALIDESGAREVTIVAHDWGAVVAWFFAMCRMRPLAKLVIVNVPHPAVFVRVARTTWRQRLRSWYVLALQIPFLPERLLSRDGGKRLVDVVRKTARNPSGFAPAEIASYETQASDFRTVRAMIAWYRSAVRSGLFTKLETAAIPKIDVPTLLLWGEDDRALGKETTYGTGEYVADLRTVYLAGCSHWVGADAPERANAALADFLATPAN